MKITSIANAVTINGNIKSVSDFQNIKTTLDSLVIQHQNITLNIYESLSITSSVIGYLNKLVLKDGIRIQMNIGNTQLMELIEELNLKSVFLAQKV